MRFPSPPPASVPRQFGGAPTTGLLTAVGRGLRGCCPRCGGRPLLAGYLRISERCPTCGLELDSYRTDDAAPYATILVVGHLVVPAMLMLEIEFEPAAWVHTLIWVPVTLALTLALLPRIKGALIGAQWVFGIKS